MNKVIYLNTLQPGDRVILPKSNIGLIQHHAIYIGKDGLGNRLYIENAIGRGVQLVKETYLFRDGYNITRIEPFIGNQRQRNIAVKTAVKMIGKEYNLINFNCEHYANTVQYSFSHSEQVGKGIFFGFIALIIGVGLINKTI